MTDFPYATAPCVGIERIQDGPMTFVQIVVKCAHPNCACTYCKRAPGKPLPTEALTKFTERAGWTQGRRLGEFYCPDHS